MVTKLEYPPAKEQRAQLSGDPHRPSFHFIAPSNWMNDPHGLIEWNGRYHLFYQYNPNGPFHGTIHWGHATSADLVHWQDLAPALAPSPGSYDQDGCWTGCAVSDNGVPTIFYTAAFPQTVAAAVSNGDLLSWNKVPENPLISGPPPSIGHLAGGDFRDPYVWKTPEGWEMGVASRIEGQGGRVLLYRSTDLRRWSYVGVLMHGSAAATQPFWQGTMWECPNWLDFGSGQVLMLSVQGAPHELLYAVYFSGRRDGDVFVPQDSAMLVHGGALYAPHAAPLGDGRFVMFGWLLEGRSQQAVLEAGWSGSLSLPVELNLHRRGHLTYSPIEELRSLRRHHAAFANIGLEGEQELRVNHDGGKALELRLRVRCEGAAEFGLAVFCTPGREEETRIIYRADQGLLAVERDRASLDRRADANPATMPLALGPGSLSEWRIFLDQSIVEIFIDDTHYLACRVYPTLPDSRGLVLISRGGRTLIEHMDIWTMNPVWSIER